MEARRLFFVGIGGIGMSALARYFLRMGCDVAGYDRTPSPLTLSMSEEEGFEIIYTDAVASIPERFRSAGTEVVYTPAVPSDSAVMTFFREGGFSMKKRAEVLGDISLHGEALCVAGTHGKTSTTTLLAHLMRSSHLGCSAFVGGISKNWNSNLLVDTDSRFVVAEADEYDRSFLHLHPSIAVVTATDNDHMDIYHTREALLEAFHQFACQCTDALFVREGLSLVEDLRREGVPVVTYAFSATADCRAENWVPEEEGCHFDYVGPTLRLKGLELKRPGRVNVENAVAAVSMALAAGVTPDEIRASLPLWQGVVRRFDIHVQRPDIVYMDDYAHHPREIEALLTAVREGWPRERVTVAFQPHLYSRTHDFYREFASALNLADEVILLEIYPARELPVEGVSSQLIAQYLTVPYRLIAREELMPLVASTHPHGIFLSVGAGDIDRFVPELTRFFETEA